MTARALTAGPLTILADLTDEQAAAIVEAWAPRRGVTCCACTECKGTAFYLDGPVERECRECHGTGCRAGSGCIEDHDCYQRHTPCDECGECRDIHGPCESESCYCATHEQPVGASGCRGCAEDAADERGDWLRDQAKDEFDDRDPYDDYRDEAF